MTNYLKNIVLAGLVAIVPALLPATNPISTISAYLAMIVFILIFNTLQK
ncbi:MAG: hypothetical protein ACTSYA_09920 [Candidatus Kariarchaeaceae archaeon]